MNGTSKALPSIKKIAAALRTTTEILAGELAAPSKDQPQWTDFEWHIARAVAAMQGISSLLFNNLRWEGPESWRRFLHEQRDQSVARDAQIARLLDRINTQAQRKGVAIVALKGAALRTIGMYTVGERPMGDIDLLIRRDDATATVRVLEDCSYSTAFAIKRHQVFQPKDKRVALDLRLGEHVDNPIKIEVHTSVAERLPVVTTDITPFLFPRVMQAGLNGYSSASSLMMHLLLHAAGNMRARALRLIQLHDIALLSKRLEAGEWEELFAARPNGRTLWWALAPMMLTTRYYPGAIPPGLLAPLTECPWLLRKRARKQHLADVSWSNIRIEAFPGVEWSGTPREALAFMAGRIWPSREARLELKEGAAQIPDSSTIPWYGISHSARILRWLFSRPPRVQTLLNVRAALAHE